MPKKQKRILTGVLCAITALWLLLMWRLSSADGTETLRDSMRIARKICALLYDDPTWAQLNHVNLLLRKLAHVFLYLVLGAISALLWQLLLDRFSPWARILPAMGCCIAIAFLDELQKIPIEGRHFSLSESLLNAGSAMAMILLCSLLFFLLWRRHSRRSHTSE